MQISEFHAWLADEQRRPLVMGVLNVTPDSFSDGGRYASVEAAIAHGRSQIAAGAEILDIGGESTRPGAQRIPAQQQIERVAPVFEALRNEPAVLSIDTTSSSVAQAAIQRGAALINDISGATDDPRMLATAARAQVPIVLMHMQGQPATMQQNPTYDNVVEEILTFLRARIQAAQAAGLPREMVLVDPGIGFGKTLEHNLILLRDQKRFLELGRPVVIGASRKGFVGRITDEPEPSRRLFGTAATVGWSISQGAAIVRVHDVPEMGKVVRMVQAMQMGKWEPTA